MRPYLTLAFRLSVMTFLVLWYADWQLPGFVSDVFPLWLPLLVVLGLGLLELQQPARAISKPRNAILTAGIMGLILGLSVFPALVVFGDWQILLVLAVMAMPMLMVAYLLYD
jgi:hypothetical protein